jgi:ATP-dependent 26S proteasome regulatory subunit
VISFPMPRPGERLDLWKKAIPEAVTLGDDVNLHTVAGKYEISGGAMMNVVRYCLLMTLRRGSSTITFADLEEGVRREYKKEGRSV